MKKQLLILLFATTTSIAFSQDYMDDITSTACECLNNVPKDATGEQRQARMGLCIIEAAIPYEKELKKDYGIDINDMPDQAEKLGRILGMKMLPVCPYAMMQIVKDAEENEDLNDSSEDLASGQIVKIEDNGFAYFTLKEENGRNTKFYWLTFIETNLDIDLATQYEKLLNANVEITFISQEVFDPRISEYRPINIIRNINLVK